MKPKVAKKTAGRWLPMRRDVPCQGRILRGTLV